MNASCCPCFSRWRRAALWSKATLSLKRLLQYGLAAVQGVIGALQPVTSVAQGKRTAGRQGRSLQLVLNGSVGHAGRE
jgi:hypothetical protein